MKKLNNLTHIFIFLALFSTLLTSCGTEEDLGDESLELTLSAPSVVIGNSISFNVSSSIAGDVSAQAVFFVNDTQITGNSFIPTEVNDTNEVYATYNGKTTSVKTFASTEVAQGVYTQKVLVEDYTGTWCGWCPRMTSILRYLTDYSDRVIPIAIHTQGTPTDPWLYEYAADMQSPSVYNTGGAPAGQYNRIHKLITFQDEYPCPNTRNIYYPQLDGFLNNVAPLGLAINSSLSGNSLSINIKVGFATDNITNARLVVNLTEDDIIYQQANYYVGNTTCDPEYNYGNMPNPILGFHHEHVLLKSYTDIYGDPIPANNITEGGIWSRDFNVSLPSNVTNPANLKIVAFILGNGSTVSSREVLNVQSAKVGTNQGFD